MDNRHLNKIFEGGNTGDPLEEIVSLSSEICPDANDQQIREIYNDMTKFFSGSDPFFQKNTLQYHDLRHTQMVALATARLFHGLHCNRVPVNLETLTKGLLSAYFHDTGMLLLEGDSAKSASDYIADHEERSILFLKRYVTLKDLNPDMAEDCAVIIRYTNLSFDPAAAAPHSRDTQLAGQVVGSADILAQMADRYYLEALSKLHEELKAANTIYKHNSVLDLMVDTSDFYHNIILKRLIHTFSNTYSSMQTHFRERYKVDRDLYSENINKNINYLEEIITECKKEMKCIQKFLRRKPPVT